MNQEKEDNVDINTANEEKLIELQGVGTSLAKRIIDARPFTSIDDLTRVRGISQNDVERLRPSLTISKTPKQSKPQEGIQNVEETVEKADKIDSDDLEVGGASTFEVLDAVSASDNQSQGIVETTNEELGSETIDSISEDEGPPAEHQASEQTVDIEGTRSEDMDELAEISADAVAIEAEYDDKSEITDKDLEPELPSENLETGEELTKEPLVTQPTYITRGGTCGLVLTGAFFTIILAVAITLGIISSINQGRLSYASPSQVAILQSQYESLSSVNQTLAEDIDSLRNRINNLEALGGQVSEIEIEINDIQEEIDQLQGQIVANQAAYEELVVRTENIEEDIQSLKSQGDRFENFLEGLRNLMKELYPQTLETEEIP